MKTRLIFGGILIMALTCSTTAWAQTLGGGVKVGVNFATVSGINDPGLTTSQRVGLVAGGFLTLTLAPMVAFEPEVLLSMQGTKLHRSGSGVSGDSTAKVDYVQVPLLLRLGPTGKDRASAYVVVGPTLGVLRQAKEERSGQPDEDFKDQLKSTGVGLLLAPA